MEPTKVVPRQVWASEDYRAWENFVVIETDDQYTYCRSVHSNRKRTIKIERLLAGKAYTYQWMMSKRDFKRLSDPYRKY